MTPAFALGAVAVYGNRLEKMVLGLDNITFIHYNVIVIGVWRSLVSRLVRVQEASGSNPDTPTKIPVTTSVVSGIFFLSGFERTAPVRTLV